MSVIQMQDRLTPRRVKEGLAEGAAHTCRIRNANLFDDSYRPRVAVGRYSLLGFICLPFFILFAWQLFLRAAV